MGVGLIVTIATNGIAGVVVSCIAFVGFGFSGYMNINSNNFQLFIEVYLSHIVIEPHDAAQKMQQHMICIRQISSVWRQWCCSALFHNDKYAFMVVIFGNKENQVCFVQYVSDDILKENQHEKHFEYG